MPTGSPRSGALPNGASSDFPSVDAVVERFGAQGYLADRALATSLFLALRLERPLFLEGEAGVGKTAVARTLAQVTGGRLIRLQCYEGIDAATALYEWDYPRQMLAIRLLEARGEGRAAEASDIFREEFLIKRPLLQALAPPDGAPAVLLIDEVDRADEEFEALLLELLADFAITIPEIGTVTAPVKPRVILTSNRTREVHDALKRRCLYHWIDYPSFERELAIVETRLPGIGATLANEVVGFVQRLRTVDLTKVPGVAETLDWAAALTALGAERLSEAEIDRTLGVLLKYQEDVTRLRTGARPLLDEVRAGKPGDGLQ